MNQVARVFVVINILLSAAFLMAAATFLHQSTDWRSKTTEISEQKDKSDAAFTQQIAQADATEKNLRDDVNSGKATVNSLENDLQAAKTAEANAVEQKNQTERKHTALQQTHDQLTSSFSALKDSVSGLEDRIETYRKEREAAQDAERVALKTQGDLSTQREGLLQNKKDLGNQVKDLEGKLQACMTELQSYRGAYPPPTNKSQPMVEGQVIRFDSGTNMVQVNKGASDGVRLGHTFDIVRGSDYVCTVMIDYIDGSTSVGHISVPGTSGKRPQSGDKATKLSGM